MLWEGAGWGLSAGGAHGPHPACGPGAAPDQAMRSSTIGVGVKSVSWGA